MKAVREEVKLRVKGFIKQVGFKPGGKERELWMSSGESKEEEMGKE